jgi:hypothetical protein
MHSTFATLALKETDPHDIFVIEPDVVLAARADQSSAKPKDVRPPASQDRAFSDVVAGLQAPSLDAPVRAAAVDSKTATGRSALRKWARRAAVAFLFAFCSAIAAAGWKHYGDTAKAMAMSVAPKFVLAASPQETPTPAEQAQAPALQAAVADQTAAQPTSAGDPSADAAAPVPAVPPTDTAQLLQSMAQQIEQLKASVDQLKAGQDQMARDITRNAEAKPAAARTPEPNLRPKLPAPLPRTAALPVHKPKPAYPPVQASAAPALPRVAAPLPQTYAAPAPLPPPPPVQAIAEPDGAPVVRPPMPLR